MSIMKRPVVAIAAMLVISVAAMADNEDAAARGATLLQPFKQDLKQALVTGLQQGPEVAISVCKLEAPSIAAKLSTGGVTMGRTSHRLRNPANAGPAWAEAVLQDYLGADADIGPQVRRLDDGRTGYVEPIRMQAMCLTCHGTAVTPELTARINREYPEDKATGFEAGDLRGVFWVAFVEDAGEAPSRQQGAHHQPSRHHQD